MAISSIVIHTYKLTNNSIIGEGSFATVHRAISHNNTYVAIKINKDPSLNTIKHEAQILSYLNKQLPNANFIPILYWYGIFSGRSCMVTPIYVPLTTVNFIEILSLLEAIHSVDIVHCDIKPDNFMQCPVTKRTVLIDFGLARAVAPNKFNTNLCGSPRYTSYYCYLGYTPSPRDDLISAGYVYMETLGYVFNVVEPMNDPIYDFANINHKDNVLRKEQRTLEALLSYRLPKHLEVYFQTLYSDDPPDYHYLKSLFQSLPLNDLETTI
jgi:serine/threonine protein kinase